jgi:endonuclease YncB( thermonuclease family)
MGRLFFVLLVLAVAAPTGSAPAGETIAGPVSAAVVDVVDGDTIRVRAHVWLGHEISVSVRIRGIDAPEDRLARCRAEKVMSAAARDRLAELARGELRLANITGDKYFGRVDADVTNAAGVDLRAAMLQSGLARPYDGAGKNDWCGDRQSL